MKAMIFAAGKGTRLKPLTDYCPKALIEVAGKPMLEHVILKLKSAGFTELVVNVHHLAQQIIDYLTANDFGLTIHISDERGELLETGGGLQKAAPFFRDDENGFLLHNADILSNCNLQALMQEHSFHPSALATMVVSHRKTNRYLLFDKEQRLRGWVNKQTGETKPEGFVYQEGMYEEYAYAGIQAVNPCIFKTLPAGRFSIIDFYLSVCHHEEIRAFIAPDLKILDIGKPETLRAAEQFITNL